jgi:hypothetical protein
MRWETDLAWLLEAEALIKVVEADGAGRTTKEQKALSFALRNDRVGRGNWWLGYEYNTACHSCQARVWKAVNGKAMQLREKINEENEKTI